MAMATIGIMSHGMPPNLKSKNTFNKLIITTNSGINNVGILSENSSNKLVINSNSIVKQIKDFGMIGSVNNSGAIIMRKKQKLIPLNESNCENTGQNQINLHSPTPQSAAASKKEKPVNRPGRKPFPAPTAVERRNARERNRVKQVNNGFAALRQHIPEEIAKTFEALNGTNKTASKKLSKVETLRMAVEYIRGLEKLLGYEIPPVSPLSGDDGNYTVIKDEFGPISPANETENFDNYDDSNGADADLDLNLPPTDDNLPNITTYNGSQYIRIPGTNTYQLLNAGIFGNEENFSPLIDVNCYQNDDLTSEDIHVSMLATIAPVSSPSDTMLPVSMTTDTSPLSPATSSPAPGVALLQDVMPGSRGNEEIYIMPPEFQTINDAPLRQYDHQVARVKVEPSDIDFNKLNDQHSFGNASPNIETHSNGYFMTTGNKHDVEQRKVYEGVLRLKKELDDVILDTSAATLSDESMMDAIDWWEANTPKSDGGHIL